MSKPALVVVGALLVGTTAAYSAYGGWAVVKVNKVLPANALAAIPYVGRMRAEIQQQTSDDYARQFVAAMREDLKVRRNDKAIQSMKQRFASQGS